VSKEGIAPIVPEDLIYRFAMKLEFGELTVTVANTAIKLASRMSIDWMVMGRRPAGVCGACLIVAARMHNFRRTVTEVVYIVKVTTATIQKRLDEFKLTPASNLSVEEFLSHDPDPAGAAHDPPSFYEKQEEFIKNKKTRKRKRRGQLLEEEDEENQEGNETDPNKRQKTTTPNADEALPTVELRRDADGFAIPPQPVRPQSESEFADIIDETAENPTDDALQKIAEKFLPTEGNVSTSDNEDDEDGGSSTTSTTTTPKRDRQRKRRVHREIAVPAAWSDEENQIADMIREHLTDPKLAELVSDPNTKYHKLLYDMAEKKTQQHMADFEKENPSKNIRDDEEILEDEFANDPEVQNCLLSSEDIARKEKLWVNENKAWLRQQQIKAIQKRMAANGPPKRTRNRKKMVRIGEGQASPASSAGEAAVNALKQRALSKKINYTTISTIFDDMDGPGGGALGSAATSRVTSRAGSSVPESLSASGSVTNDEDSEMGDEDDYIRPPKPSTSSTAARDQTPPPAEESEDEEDSDDYVEEENAEASWKDQGNRGIDEGGEEEGFGEEHEDENDFNDMGDIDVFA
jgi:transcription factor IIIB 90 kDa subunit